MRTLQTYKDSDAYPVGDENGMSLREAFVMAAMQGLCAQPLENFLFAHPGAGSMSENLAEMAVSIADETLKALYSSQDA